MDDKPLRHRSDFERIILNHILLHPREAIPAMEQSLIAHGTTQSIEEAVAKARHFWERLRANRAYVRCGSYVGLDTPEPQAEVALIYTPAAKDPDTSYAACYVYLHGVIRTSRKGGPSIVACASKASTEAARQLLGHQPILDGETLARMVG